MRRLLPLIFLLIASPAWASFGAPTISTGTCATATTCAVTVTSTGSGHLLLGIATTKTAARTITGMAGGSTGSFNSGAGAWYHPAGGGGQAAALCASSDASAGSADCAYVLKSTSGATTVTFTFSGTSGGATCFVIEVPYGNGPIQAELPMEADQSSSSAPAGAALWLGGTNDFIVQAINAVNSISAIGGGYTISGTGPAIAYLSNSATGTAPTWTQSSSGAAAVFGIAFAEYIPVAGLNPNNWIVNNRAGYATGNIQCFVPGNVAVSAGGMLQLTSQHVTATCASIDLASTADSYTSAFVAMRSFNFLYGTLEYRAKFGGGASSGNWPVVWLYDASCQPSNPTGTDNNSATTCNEIDVSEVLNSTFTSINEQIHVPGHNDQCTATVSDASANFHTYDLIWSSGSLIWQVDGVTTCTITQAYVPGAAEFVGIAQYMGANGGTITNGDLPWTSNFDYLKVIQSGVVVFEDDFNTPVSPRVTR